MCVCLVRMGKDGVHPGTAYTLVTNKQAQFASELVYHLEASENIISSSKLSPYL